MNGIIELCGHIIDSREIIGVSPVITNIKMTGGYYFTIYLKYYSIAISGNYKEVKESHVTIYNWLKNK
jgi:hypothetical protein